MKVSLATLLANTRRHIFNDLKFPAPAKIDLNPLLGYLTFTEIALFHHILTSTCASSNRLPIVPDLVGRDTISAALILIWLNFSVLGEGNNILALRDLRPDDLNVHRSSLRKPPRYLQAQSRVEKADIQFREHLRGQPIATYENVL